jgi:hypothetical protein
MLFQKRECEGTGIRFELITRRSPVPANAGIRKTGPRAPGGGKVLCESFELFRCAERHHNA